MLTPRGWSILIVNFILLGVALLDWEVLPMFHVRSSRYPNTSLEVIGLTLLLWFGGEWLLFVYRARVVARQLRITRALSNDQGTIETLWARQGFQVRLLLELPGALRLPFVRVSEQLPYGAEHVDGETRFEGEIEPGSNAAIAYRLRCTAIGSLRFEGVRVQIADPQGFFYFATFISMPALYRILPPLTDDQGRSSTVKRYNLLPPPGVHRLRRAGSGSELLDLRDYLPGDPPKTIAWKASARRDRLITKEFESEVPLRCTLFVDRSQAVLRGGPGANVLTRLVEIAAGVAQANASARDLTGLCLFDETATTYLRPAHGARHLVTLMQQLTEAAGLMPSAEDVELTELVPLAYRFAERVYPDLLRPDVNSFPDWLPWLFPHPAYTRRRPNFGDRVYQRLPYLTAMYLIGGVFLLTGGITLSIALVFAVGWAMEPALFALVVGLAVFGVAMALFRLPSSFFPERRRMQRWSKRLAALLSVRYGLAPGGLSALMEDEKTLAHYLQRFLADHRVPVPGPIFDLNQRSAATRKVRLLGAAPMRAVRKEHDNELFVLMVDLLEAPADLDPLLRAVKVAVARHHQVMIVLPWPKGVPLPDRAAPPKAGISDRFGMGRAAERLDVRAERGNENTSDQRLHQRFHEVRRGFVRLGVPVICAADAEPTRLILERLERLRLIGGKR